MTDFLMDTVKSNRFVILYTETTGLGINAEVVSISIIDHNGAVLLDMLVKPMYPIPADATRIHGITNDDVKDAPDWETVRGLAIAAIGTNDLVIYNRDYDLRILDHCDTAYGHIIDTPWFSYVSHCAMLWYAEKWGDWNDYHQNYRWQRLTNAMHQQGLPVVNAHHALGDCLMTLSLLRKFAAEGTDNE
jgi:DNA polymerase-3 subunit epsilon